MDVGGAAAQDPAGHSAPMVRPPAVGSIGWPDPRGCAGPELRHGDHRRSAMR